VETLDRCALRDPFDMIPIPRREKFIIGGQLISIRPTVTKKGRNPGAEMAHISVMWNEAEFRIVCFPEAWANCKMLLTIGKPVACHVERLDQGCSLLTVERLDLLFDQEGIA
jgi:hypothetical protein